MNDKTCDLTNLNRPISEVFTNHPRDWEELIRLKALIGAYLSNLERVFRGVFGQELQLEGTKEQYDLFRKVFPIVGNAMEKSFGLSGFSGFCGKLGAFRSICAHAFSKASQQTEFIDIGFIRNIPNWNWRNYRYNIGNQLTLCGMLAILICMGNKEMVSGLASSGISPLVNRIGLWSTFYQSRGKAYGTAMEENLGNDLETEIRSVPGHDLFTAIWGEYAFRVEGDPSRFSYHSTKGDRHSIYHVLGSITDGPVAHIHIGKHSVYHVYFSEDYELDVLDQNFFIECANQVPPFLFLAYLYCHGIHRFDRQSLSSDDLMLFVKLNRAKFYVDKNISVILLGKVVSDQRMIHQAAAPQALSAILNLEWNLRISHREEIERFGVYSTIKESLLLAGVDKDLVREALALRNFFVHGSIFGDYVGLTENSYRKMDLSDCLIILKNLVLALRENDIEASEHLRQDVFRYLAKVLMDTKYKFLAKNWLAFFKGERIDWVTYGKTMKRISASYVDTETEEKLAWFADEENTFRYDVVQIELAEPVTLLPAHQQTCKGLLTVCLQNEIVDLQVLLGSAASSLATVEERSNKIIHFRKLVMRGARNEQR